MGWPLALFRLGVDEQVPQGGDGLAEVALDVVAVAAVGHGAHQDGLPRPVVVQRVFLGRGALPPVLGQGDEVEDGGGTFKVLNLPFRMSGAKVSVAKRMSTLGEHTRAHLKETGLSEEEISSFAGKGQGTVRG